VREYGCVPAGKILDEHGYKALYHRKLMELVHARLKQIQRGELSPQDFEIIGARLIRAGADFLIPDYTKLKHLRRRLGL
jgi:hypothetical protein